MLESTYTSIRYCQRLCGNTRMQRFCFVFSENIWVSHITASGPQSHIYNYMSSYHINTKASGPQTLRLNMTSYHIYITASGPQTRRLNMTSYHINPHKNGPLRALM